MGTTLPGARRTGLFLITLLIAVLSQSGRALQSPPPLPADIIWQETTQGHIAVWQMDGRVMFDSVQTSPDRVADTQWRIAASCDFNQDSRPDILWHEQSQGWVGVWLMDGAKLKVPGGSVATNPDRVADTQWKIVGTGDANSDGKCDIYWHHRTEGYLAVWLMNGVNLIDSVELTPNRVADTKWKVVGIGDFDLNGSSDLVWRHDDDGFVAVWKMNGTALSASVLTSPNSVSDLTWKMVGTGDFNKDGNWDLLWWDSVNGYLSAWYMSGTNLLQSISISPDGVGNQLPHMWRPATIAAPIKQLRAPRLTLASGAFSQVQELTIETTIPGATIKYTTDNTAPTLTNGTTYQGPVAIDRTMTLRAKVFKDGWVEGGEASATYTFAVGPVTFTPPGGIYNQVVSLTLTSTAGATIRYTTNGDPVDENSLVFGPALTIDSGMTVKARAFRSGWTPSAESSATYAFQAATPVVTPGGWATSLPSVTMSTASGASVYYTVNAGVPTESSTLYTGAFTPNHGDRIQARALRPGWAPSATVVETYLLDADGRAVERSPVRLRLLSASAGSFHNRSAVVTFTVDGATGVIGAGTASITINGTRVGATVSANGTSVSTPAGVLDDGRNLVTVTGVDTAGRQFSERFTIIAGTRAVQIRVREGAGQPSMGNVIVKAIVDEVTFSATSSSANGASFQSVPNEPGVFFVEPFEPSGGTTEYRGAVAVAPATSSTDLILDVINQDVSRGLEGWTVPTDSTSCVFAADQAEPTSFVPCANATSGTGTNRDVRLITDTNRTTPVSVAREFVVPPDVRIVSAAFRFGSAEMQSGSTLQEDEYQVLLTVVGGVAASETKTVSQVITGFGMSPWRHLFIPVAPGDRVRLSASVTNMGDGNDPSYLDIDLIQETAITASLLELHRPAGATTTEGFATLRALSLGTHTNGSPHGHTPITGALSIGALSDSLSTVKLVLVQRDGPSVGSELGRVDLTNAANLALVGTIGSGRTYSAAPLFQFFSPNLHTSSPELEATVELTFGSGVTARVPIGIIDVWKQFPDSASSSRFLRRDPQGCIGQASVQCIGDAWTYQGVIDRLAVMTASTFKLDDVSNMHGGWFPHHPGHFDGLEADMYFAGFERRTATEANQLINFVNSHATAIEKVYVAMTPEFLAQVNNAGLGAVIVNENSHVGHFHVRFKSK